MTNMHSFTSSIAQFAQTAAPGQGPGAAGPWWQMLLFYGLIAGGFYFLFFAPQRKKQKEHEKMLSSLQSGDEVLTNGGIYGVVTNVKDDRFIVRIADNTKIEVAKGFISAVTKKSGPEETK
jgi:preprotein translocase subunit YajC